MNASRRRKPTIYDIATASDASASSVSLVLNERWREHRIKPDTAARILKVAEDLGYTVNLKARGLRLSRSGLGGMILPHYRNRFFAGLAEAFEAEARKQNLCPIVASTQRDADNEVRVTKALLAQQIEFLFITGVRDPSPLNALCRAAGVPCVNIDLPGPDAPSVVSDNLGGARDLTRVLISKIEARARPRDDWFFFGGVSDDNSTRSRIEGFREALAQVDVSPGPSTFDCNGYSPEVAERALAARYHQLGRLPAGLFMNGITALEGALKFFLTLPRSALDTTVVGAFDWDPFAAHLPFDLTMARQDVEAMIATGFALLDPSRAEGNPLVAIPTTLRKLVLLSRADEITQGSDF